MRGAVYVVAGGVEPVAESRARGATLVPLHYTTGSPVLMTACISGKVNSSSVPDNPLHSSLSGSTVSSSPHSP